MISQMSNENESVKESPAQPISRFNRKSSKINPSTAKRALAFHSSANRICFLSPRKKMEENNLYATLPHEGNQGSMETTSLGDNGVEPTIILGKYQNEYGLLKCNPQTPQRRSKGRVEDNKKDFLEENSKVTQIKEELAQQRLRVSQLLKKLIEKDHRIQELEIEKQAIEVKLLELQKSEKKIDSLRMELHELRIRWKGENEELRNKLSKTVEHEEKLKIVLKEAKDALEGKNSRSPNFLKGVSPRKNYLMTNTLPDFSCAADENAPTVFSPNRRKCDKSFEGNECTSDSTYQLHSDEKENTIFALNQKLKYNCIEISMLKKYRFEYENIQQTCQTLKLRNRRLINRIEELEEKRVKLNERFDLSLTPDRD